MAKKSRFVSFFSRQLNLLFGIISILIAAMATGILAWKYPPWQLRELYKKPSNSAFTILIHDFEDDGLSETLRIENNLNVPTYSIMFYNHKGDIIDQVGFNEPFQTGPSWISFGDYTGDNYDETLVFTQKGDSLFLSIINLNPLEWIFRRHPVLTARQENPYLKWDVSVTKTALADVDFDGKKELIFSIGSGWSLHPRGVYIFDIETKTIIHQFESDAYPAGSLVLFDLNDDGKDEIIITSAAPGNIHHTLDYSDSKCWLFVFNQQLEPLFPAISFGEYPGTLFCTPLIIEKERYLLLAYSYGGSKPLPGYLYLMNSKGQIERKKAMEGKDLSKHLVVYENESPLIYLGSTRGSYLACLNYRFELLAKRSVDLYYPNFLFSADLDGDHITEILAIPLQAVVVFDRKLRPIASYPLDEQVTNVAFRKIGPGNPLQMHVKGQKYEYRLALNKNPLYSWLSLIFVGGTLASFLFLNLSHRILTALSIYVNYFLFTLQRSSSGVLILDHRGKIFYVNKRLLEILPVPEKSLKRMYFRDAFDEYPQITAAIDASLRSKESENIQLSFTTKDFQLKGEISVKLFNSGFSLIPSYLVEIKDYTEPVLSERLKVWSRTMQKIAHDIKTPLSSVILNLDSLQIRLNETVLKDNREIGDDIQLMQNELIKIRDLTKNFLKFADLERPSFQAVNLSKLINQSLTQFRHMINERLQIQVHSDELLRDVWIDPQQMQLVFHVLIENAIDAMNGKGIIQININLAHDLLKNELEFADIEICDTGPGIPAEIRDKIFDPYFTTKRQGTGMGLAIAKKIVEDNGGQIGLYSKEKFGTVFHLRLPLVNREPSD